jgi:hypothetical protein
MTPSSLGASFGLYVGRPDHLAPLIGFIGDQLPEVGGHHWHWNAAQISKPRLHLGVGERGIDLPVELVDPSIAGC